MSSSFEGYTSKYKCSEFSNSSIFASDSRQERNTRYIIRFRSVFEILHFCISHIFAKKLKDIIYFSFSSSFISFIDLEFQVSVYWLEIHESSTQRAEWWWCICCKSYYHFLIFWNANWSFAKQVYYGYWKFVHFQNNNGSFSLAQFEGKIISAIKNIYITLITFYRMTFQTWTSKILKRIMSSTLFSWDQITLLLKFVLFCRDFEIENVENNRSWIKS